MILHARLAIPLAFSWVIACSAEQDQDADRPAVAVDSMVSLPEPGRAIQGSPGESESRDTAGVGPTPQDILSVNPATVCLYIDNAYKCAQAIERRWLEIGIPGVERRGAELVIGLADGTLRSFMDSASTEINEFFRHSYRQYYKELPLHVVELSYNEGVAYVLIDGLSGDTALSFGIPVPSPDGDRLVAASQDIDLAFIPTTLRIWRRTEFALELEFDTMFTERPRSSWGPQNPVWLDETTVRMERVVFDQYQLVTVGHMLASRASGVWIIEPDVIRR